MIGAGGTLGQPEAEEVTRLGRISYVNMAPLLGGRRGVSASPTELSRMLLDGQLDIAPIPSIEYARNADSLRILPRLCVSSEGAVDSIQLVSRIPFAGAFRGRDPESATSVVLVRILIPKAEIVHSERRRTRRS